MKLVGKENYKVGQIVYGIPYGNYARYNKDEIFKFEITKIGNKYAEMIMDGHRTYSKCTMSEGKVGEFSAGYYIYKTIQEIENERRYNELYKTLSNIFDSFRGRNDFTLEQIERIYAICQE